MRKPILAFILIIIGTAIVYGGSLTCQAGNCLKAGDYNCAIKVGLKAIELEGGFYVYFFTG